MANFCLFAVLLLCTVGANCQDCSGRPPMQPGNDCCKINFAPPQVECMKRIKEQWIAFHESTNKESMPVMQCPSNCIFDNNNVITTDNKVNPDETKLVLEKLLGTEWLALLPSIINVCKDRIDNSNSNGAHTNGKGPNSPMANCNMGKEKLLFCLREQFMTNCPDSLWQNNAECNDMRSYMKNCPFEKRNFPHGNHKN